MGTGLERTDHDGHIGVPADKDDRQIQLAYAHFLLHVQPAHAGHAHVEQHAGIQTGIAGLEKLDTTGKRQGCQADRLQ
ncbi:hypothetical protein D3C76_1606670 [compost metagenome]